MGMVKYVNRQSGAEVEADFPLHPGLVNFTKPDGSTGQAMRADFDRDYGQKLPDLPAVDPVNLLSGPAAAAGAPATPPPPYQPPAMQPLATPPSMPPTHHAWFSLIFDTVKKIEAKVADLLVHHAVLKASVESLEKVGLQLAEKQASSLLASTVATEEPTKP